MDFSFRLALWECLALMTASSFHQAWFLLTHGSNRVARRSEMLIRHNARPVPHGKILDPRTVRGMLQATPLRKSYCLKTTGGPLTLFALRSTDTSTRSAISGFDTP